MGHHSLALCDGLLLAFGRRCVDRITVKIMGSQWFWSYELGSAAFDSLLVALPDLPLGHQRQLAVDNSLLLPIHTAIRLLVSSNDVIHSFAVPSLALKVDAIPGRLNLAGLILNRPGNFYGQCSELCGNLHGFMPICVTGLTLPQFYSSLPHTSALCLRYSFLGYR